ncbi:MAG: hypothetical protein E7356_04820 [Clostridiales bacterium]|nr:hypothetical protein [Clostridiales bacterium]
MGLITKLKDIFNKNIECGSEIDDRIVFHLKKKKYLHLNKNIFVREKNVCVIVYKGKACDLILEGKHKIYHDTIPETYSRARIEHSEKSGIKIKKIRADIYYVNTNDMRSFEYRSDVPFKSKTSRFGKVKGCLAGKCTVKVFDSIALIKTLLSKYGKIRNKDVAAEIGLIIGNKINHIVQKQKIPIDMILTNQEYCEQVVNTEIQDSLDKEGLFVSNIKLKAVDFNKRNKKKVNEYISSHPTAVKPISVNSVLGATPQPDAKVRINMPTIGRNVRGAVQGSVATHNVDNFKVCRVCRKKNSAAATICNNCGSMLN